MRTGPDLLEYYVQSLKATLALDGQKIHLSLLRYTTVLFSIHVQYRHSTRTQMHIFFMTLSSTISQAFTMFYEMKHYIYNRPGVTGRWSGWMVGVRRPGISH